MALAKLLVTTTGSYMGSLVGAGLGSLAPPAGPLAGILIGGYVGEILSEAAFEKSIAFFKTSRSVFPIPSRTGKRAMPVIMAL